MNKDDIVYALNNVTIGKPFSKKDRFTVVERYTNKVIGFECFLIACNKSYYIVEKYKGLTASAHAHCTSWDKARMLKEYRQTLKYILE